ncbi:class I SAM-dependent methyltransferase [Sporolactobacillus putidus]|uniref:Methyltransferase n=1 Tax=Sporolactobacillus putidus TaxID=492735 RepID=A0A917S8A6_9BACL|nr:methyltransferase domain-containing protein [Sporolactobacillus putidus]GGL61446.1 methyltransferase [Sporolactobacillus putidus]
MNNHRYIDFLAKLAIDSAHPGGRQLTEAIISETSMKEGDKVLDVGCGTGATSALLAEKTGTEVTGIDIHPKMVELAKKRSTGSSRPFQIVPGSAERLPFNDETFDWVLSESVTAFTDMTQSAPEYFRVLRPGGKLIAIEMTIEERLPRPDSKVIQSLYGVGRLLTEDDWKEIWEKAGFSGIEALRDSDFSQKEGAVELPSYHLTEKIDEEAFDVWLSHLQILQTYRDVLTYRIFRAEKP